LGPAKNQRDIVKCDRTAVNVECDRKAVDVKRGRTAVNARYKTTRSFRSSPVSSVLGDLDFLAHGRRKSPDRKGMARIGNPLLRGCNGA